ncbi:hypothetical protein J6590_045653 [Homalodisca vitripennis]|nr:hypothetical protein J6590_045653 [Homalodisca vitripennis]
MLVRTLSNQHGEMSFVCCDLELSCWYQRYSLKAKSHFTEDKLGICESTYDVSREKKYSSCHFLCISLKFISPSLAPSSPFVCACSAKVEVWWTTSLLTSCAAVRPRALRLSSPAFKIICGSYISPILASLPLSTPVFRIRLSCPRPSPSYSSGPSPPEALADDDLVVFVTTVPTIHPADNRPTADRLRVVVLLLLVVWMLGRLLDYNASTAGRRDVPSGRFYRQRIHFALSRSERSLLTSLSLIIRRIDIWGRHRLAFCALYYVAAPPPLIYPTFLLV